MSFYNNKYPYRGKLSVLHINSQSALWCKTGVIKFWGPHENGDPEPQFHNDFGDPFKKRGTPLINKYMCVPLG